MTKNKSYIDDATGDALELDREFFANARRGRPPLPAAQRKLRVTVMLDPDVIAHFKREGRGWQTRVNAALRQAAALE